MTKNKIMRYFKKAVASTLAIATSLVELSLQIW